MQSFEIGDNKIKLRQRTAAQSRIGHGTDGTRPLTGLSDGERIDTASAAPPSCTGWGSSGVSCGQPTAPEPGTSPRLSGAASPVAAVGGQRA
jgi:hypothetical protein